MNNEYRRVARALRDEVNARVVKRVVGRLDSAVVAATPSSGDATVKVLLDGGSVAVPARAARGALFTAGDRVLVWRAGSKLRILGHAGPLTAAHPYAEASGQVNVSVSASITGTASVSFPAGRFTVTPLVMCQARATTVWMAMPSGESTSGFTATARNIAGSSGTATVSVTWRAWQMSSGSASG